MHVICLFLVLIATTESINITSDPVECGGYSYCKLSCDIGEITETVKWLYNGANIFNCSPPYSAGLCSMSNTMPHLQRITINITSGSTSAFTYGYISRGLHEGVLTCIHGNERATFDMYNVDRATVEFFQTPSTGSEGDLIRLNCTVTSKLLVDVNITISNVQHGTVILRQVKKSSLRSITTTVKAGCGYQVCRCEVWFGYGSVRTSSYTRQYKCPLQILYDQTNTTVEAVAGTYSTYFRLYFIGYPTYFTAIWYRRDGNHDIKLNGYRVYQSSHSQYLFMYIQYVHIQDAGQYSIHVNISGRIEIVIFTLKVRMPKLSTDAIYETTSMNPTSAQSTSMNPASAQSTSMNPASAQSTRMITVADNSATCLHQSDEQPFSSTTGIGIGVGIGVVGTLTLVGIIVLVVWLKVRCNLTTDACSTTKSSKRNVRKTKNTTKTGIDNVYEYENTEENIEYENHNAN